MAEELATLLEQGLVHLRDGRVNEAISAFEKVLRIDPGNRRAKDFLKDALAGGKGLGFGSRPDAAPVNSVEYTGPSAEWTPNDTDVHQVVEVVDDDEDVDDFDTTLRWVTQPNFVIGSHEAGEAPVDVDTPDDHEASQYPDTEPHEADPGRLGEAPNPDNALAYAKQMVEAGDFVAAMDAAQAVLSVAPGHEEASAIVEQCVEPVMRLYDERLGDRSRIPRMKALPDEVIWLDLDHRAGFLLSQMDGQSSVDDLFAISALSELETARLLCQLVDSGVIAIE